MKQVKRQVKVELRTVIDDQGDKELNIIKQTGTYFRKGSLQVIMFTEQNNDVGKINNVISIHPDKVTVKRSGSISMQQIFINGKRTECLYRHPYGSFAMEIETTKMIYNNGEIVIHYDATINGQERRKHHFTLTYVEE